MESFKTIKRNDECELIEKKSKLFYMEYIRKTKLNKTRK